MSTEKKQKNLKELLNDYRNNSVELKSKISCLLKKLEEQKMHLENDKWMLMADDVASQEALGCADENLILEEQHDESNELSDLGNQTTVEQEVSDEHPEMIAEKTTEAERANVSSKDGIIDSYILTAKTPKDNSAKIKKYTPDLQKPARTETRFKPEIPPIPTSKPIGKINTKTGMKPNIKPILEDEPRNKKSTKTKDRSRSQTIYDWVDIDSDDMSSIKLPRVRVGQKSSSKDKKIVKAAEITHATIDKEKIFIKELSEKIGKPAVEIMNLLFKLGVPKTINESVDFDTAELVANELGIELELDIAATTEEKVLAYHDAEEDDEKSLVSRPPIVTIMGHVDHGKTSILDYIRKAKVAQGEAGGITQHVGAYSIEVNKQKITFVDTPGHAAFTNMRARGADLTDTVIIVVAADDGVMPQTIEAINHSKAAKVNIIVAINKIDKGIGNIDKLLNQLAEHGLLTESWGGDIPCVHVSAKTGEGIQELLDTILISSELMELKANPNRRAQGTVIEAKLDKGMGPVATIIVQNGTLKVGDYVVVGTSSGRVRGMYDHLGKKITKAGPSTPTSILGLQNVPEAGDIILSTSDEKTMKEVVQERINREKENMYVRKSTQLEDVFKEIAEGKLKTLNIIVKTDVKGTAEALKDSLKKLSTDEVKVEVIHAMAGAINESDIMLAETTNSIIIGFNVRADANSKQLSDVKKIDVKLYRVIYDAIDDVSNAVKGLSSPKLREEYLGSAEVRKVYNISGVGIIAGCMVKDGKIVRNANVRVVSNNIVVAETSISSLKRVKDDVKEVAAGYECGIGLDKIDDLKEGDIIESFLIKAEK